MDKDTFKEIEKSVIDFDSEKYIQDEIDKKIEKIKIDKLMDISKKNLCKYIVHEVGSLFEIIKSKNNDIYKLNDEYNLLELKFNKSVNLRNKIEIDLKKQIEDLKEKLSEQSKEKHKYLSDSMCKDKYKNLLIFVSYFSLVTFVTMTCIIVHLCK